MKVLMAEVNISEGKDLDLVEQVKAALLDGEEVDVMDINSNANHNRTVFTYKGSPEAVLAGTKRLATKAIELIDMTKHIGSHPRIGAVDVVPFIPVKDVSIDEALVVARAFGKYLGDELGVPVYYYEDAATCEERKNLVRIRKGEYEALCERMKDPAWVPDEGPKDFNAKSGATVTGVRFPLVAFNVNLKTADIAIAKQIVKAVRGAAGGYQNVRAIALPLEERGIVQVSMNLTDYTKTSVYRAFEAIKMEAKRYGVSVLESELVGLVPMQALIDCAEYYLQLASFGPMTFDADKQVMENRLLEEE